MGSAAVDQIVTDGSFRAPQFPLMKFRAPALPVALIVRRALQDRLAAGADRRLTLVVGPAGAGKSVLLADWAASRPPGATAWMSCDGADNDQVRFWAGFIEAVRGIEPGFGKDAADVLEMDGRISADLIAAIGNDLTTLPAGTAIVIDNFQVAAAAVASDMTDLVDCWPAKTVQLVLASRLDPQLRVHRIRMSGELCEIRDRDLFFSLDEARDLLAKSGVQVSETDLAALHQRSEGWPAALKMMALAPCGPAEPACAARASESRDQAIVDYFLDEVLDRQPPEVARFMLDTSVLEELTAPSCVALSAQHDAAALLRAVDAAGLFLVSIDEQRTRFRYHHMVRQALKAELRVRDPAREHLLQLRAAEWFERVGDARRAAGHFMVAHRVHRALSLLRDRGVAGFLQNPVPAAPLDLSGVRAETVTDHPDELLALAADLLLSGDIDGAGRYLDLLDRVRAAPLCGPSFAARLDMTRALRFAVTGQAHKALGLALRVQAAGERARLGGEWACAVPLVLLRSYSALGAQAAVEQESAAVLASAALPESVRLVLVPGTRALALAEAGRLGEAAAAARAAQGSARRLGFERHVVAVDHLRALISLALEQRDLDTADSLVDQVLPVAGRWPLLEFLALLDEARTWSARGHVRTALDTVESARMVLSDSCSALRARADELEVELRLSLGEVNSATELADGLPPSARRELLTARIALDAGDHRAAQERLTALPMPGLTPRRALQREILLAGAAIERGDPAASRILGHVLHLARRQGFLDTVVSTAPRVTTYLVEQATRFRMDPFVGRLVAVALEVRAAQPGPGGDGRALAYPLTAAEKRVLQYLPTSSYAQIADSLYISRNTVKTHLRSIYQKLGATSRAQAVERAIGLHLL